MDQANGQTSPAHTRATTAILEISRVVLATDHQIRTLAGIHCPLPGPWPADAESQFTEYLAQQTTAIRQLIQTRADTLADLRAKATAVECVAHDEPPSPYLPELARSLARDVLVLSH